MNIQQLEYILAVQNYQSFTKAAEACNVTQATLSMMIKKLEEELEIVIFDRSKQPIIATQMGKNIIEQSIKILGEIQVLNQIAQHEKKEITGDLKIGIIPTIAPYLLPIILKKYQNKYPKVNLFITECTTNQIIEKLKSNQIDVGILSTPIQEISIREYPLYYEKYFLYVNNDERKNHKNYIMPEDIDIHKLWLLEEGHCMRNQILNLCELKKKDNLSENLHYEAGSISTLMNLVDHHYGVTIIPELALEGLSKQRQNQVIPFGGQVPVREIGLVTHYHYAKERLVKSIQSIILDQIPSNMKAKPTNGQILNI